MQGAHPVRVEVGAHGEVLAVPAVQQHADVEALPAFEARHDPDERVLEGVPRRGRGHRGTHASRAARRASGARRSGSHGLGAAEPGSSSQPSGTARRPRRGGRRRPAARAPRRRVRLGGERGQDVVGHVVGTCYGGRRAGPRVVEVQAGAVVDQPQVAVPAQQVRVAPASGRRSRPGRRTTAPRRLGRVDRVREGSKPERAGEEVHPEIRAALARSSSWTSGSGSARAMTASSSRPPARAPAGRGPGQPAGDDLGDQRLDALTGAGELNDVGAQVVGLNQPGERTALAQRRHVPRGGDPPRAPASPVARPDPAVRLRAPLPCPTSGATPIPARQEQARHGDVVPRRRRRGARPVDLLAQGAAPWAAPCTGPQACSLSAGQLADHRGRWRRTDAASSPRAPPAPRPGRAGRAPTGSLRQAEQDVDHGAVAVDLEQPVLGRLRARRRPALGERLGGAPGLVLRRRRSRRRSTASGPPQRPRRRTPPASAKPTPPSRRAHRRRA